MALRVQVLNNYILTHNLYQNYYYPNPKYPIIRYMTLWVGFRVIGLASNKPLSSVIWEFLKVGTPEDPRDT